MKVHEVIARIEADGWQLARTRGSHRQFKHPSKPGTVTVAAKTELGSAAGHPEQHPQASRAEVMRYAIVIEKSETGYGAYVPDLPGCVAVAEHEDEVRGLIREAIEFHLDGLRQDGEDIPSPTAHVEYVDVPQDA